MPQLLSLLHTIFDMGIVLGFMILIHEFGHFAAAKYFGVRVEQFAIGFGKRLIGFRRGGTDYRINALPLGGYVKMSGENPMDDRTGDPGEFLSHPRWQRFIIALAGPTMRVRVLIFPIRRIRCRTGNDRLKPPTHRAARAGTRGWCRISASCKGARMLCPGRHLFWTMR